MTTAQVSTVASSGSNSIDSLLSGYCWSSASITYSFPTQGSLFLSEYSTDNEPWNGFQSLSELQKSAARMALSEWASVANLNFVEVEEPRESGIIRIAQSNVPSTAWGYYPSDSETGGDIWFGFQEDYSDPEWQMYANYAFSTFLHEIGHALGLKHPGNYSSEDSEPYVDSSIDALQYSVMSYLAYPGASQAAYVVEDNYPQTPMINDIAAIQYMYGANYSYNAEDTTYSFQPGDITIFKTIWDGGGNDTYDCSLYTTNVVLQLEPGAWSTFSADQLAELSDGQVPPGNVANALLYENNPSSLIENAVGGTGNDLLVGNSADNALYGGAGNDQLWGSTAGDDLLSGGAGADIYWWGKGDGRDQVVSSADNAQDAVILYNVQTGEHSAQNSNGNLCFTLADGSILTLEGWFNSAANARVSSFVFADNTAYVWNNGSGSTVSLSKQVYEDDGIHHVVSLDTGNCLLSGGTAADCIEGGSGNDHLWGGSGGNDWLNGGSGSDTYWFSAGDGYDTVGSSGSNSQDLIYIYGNLTVNDFQVALNGNDLCLTYSTNQLTIKDWNVGGGYQLNQFYFASNQHTYQLTTAGGKAAWV